jgi:phosphoribosylformylglycinamidine synthase
MQDVIAFANRGGPVLAICNGFQIACEAGLLPGALLRNASLKFVCEFVGLRVESNETLFTNRYEKGSKLMIPVAHGDGRYTADEATLDKLEGDGRVVFRYVGGPRDAEEYWSPNGSMRAIAGIVNDAGNVLGMMPHPERAVDPLLGSADGLGVFESMLARVAV